MPVKYNVGGNSSVDWGEERTTREIFPQPCGYA